MTRGISSANKLEGMYALFTEQDDKKLGRGEVDALAGWYGGLHTNSKRAVKARMLEIYNQSDYQRGQKEWFREGLLRAGLTMAEIEGVDPNTPDGFAMMSKEAQFDRLLELRGFWGDGTERDIAWNQINAGARPKIRRAIEDFKDDFERDHHGPDGVYFHDERATAIYLGESDSGRAQGLVGYSVELGIDTGHEADRTLFFNRAGEHLGTQYTGE